MRKLNPIKEKTKELAEHGCEGLWLYSELLMMVKTHQDQYESNNSALDTKLAEYQSRGTASTSCSVNEPELLFPDPTYWIFWIRHYRKVKQKSIKGTQQDLNIVSVMN